MSVRSLARDPNRRGGPPILRSVPAVLLCRDGPKTTERPPEDLSELRDKPCWLDLVAPGESDLGLVAKELSLHPLAVEDALQRYERPKIEQYEGHYFIVFYALEEPEPGIVNTHQVSIFVLANAIVTVHDKEFAARTAVEKRFREGGLASSGLLLHALLDTMVDQYFQIVDGFGDRVEQLESMIMETRPSAHQLSLRELFALKRDLLRIRHLIAPEREVLSALARGEITELREAGRRAYYQDVYDHIVRVTDEIDTFRDLTSNVIDAHLAAASNRLNEVMKVLTSVATILLVLSVVTSFFGMNFEILPFGSPSVFWMSMAATGVVAVLLLVYFRRKRYL
ncbi:magnesium/cobalt transporter CorA [soil metagenome]